LAKSIGKGPDHLANLKKIAPVKARVCAVIVEDSHRPKETRDAMRTVVFKHIADKPTGGG
jgi:hypothetical protein